MKLVYSRRALTDLNEIGAYYSASASPAIAEAIGAPAFAMPPDPLRASCNALRSA